LTSQSPRFSLRVLRADQGHRGVGPDDSRGLTGPGPAGDPRSRWPGAVHDEQCAAEDQGAAQQAEAPCQRCEPAEASARGQVDRDPWGAVDVHDHGGVGAGLEVPGQRLGAGAAALRGPEPLIRGSLAQVTAGATPGQRVVERVGAQVADLVVRRAAQVARDVGARCDPDEDGPCALGPGAQPHGGEVMVGPPVVGAGLAEVHDLAGEGHRLGAELLGRGAEEPVVVALGGHGPAEAEASEQQREAHEGEQDADDEGDGAVPAGGGAAWLRWRGVGGHGCGLLSRRQATS